jgi:nucleoside-diphosphate-sugar epimerase
MRPVPYGIDGVALKLLFIGGTGNISTDCAELLHRRGHEIYVISRGRAPVPPAYHSLLADRQDAAALRAALGALQPDVVLDFLGYELAEVQLDYELFHGRVGQYIFISSATVHAKPPARLPITEDAPLGNVYWEYARKKLACEQWLRRQTDFPVTIVRPSHTYSKLWVPNPVASSSFTFAARLRAGQPVIVPDDGENPWTLTATSDFATALAGLVGNTAALGETFHITSDEVLTWNQICAEIAAALGVAEPRIVKIPTDFLCRVHPRMTGTLKGDKAQPGIFDNAKIKRFVPEFQCRKPFRAGVRESVAWLLAHPEHQNLNPKVDAEIETAIAAWQATGASQQ